MYCHSPSPTHSVRLWVEIVGVDAEALLCGRQGERSDASHHVAQHVLWPQTVDKALVLLVQPRVPVDFGKVKPVGAVALVDLLGRGV